jgi:hypothetical protein
MNFFDLDCCRFSFDENNVYTIAEGIRSMMLRTNILESYHERNQLYLKRACKYAVRYIDTWLFIGINYFSHFMPLKYWEKKIRSKCEGVIVYGSVKGYGDMDTGMYTVFNYLRDIQRL